MAGQGQFEELARQLGAIGSVKRDLERILPPDCPGGSATVLGLLGRYGEMRMTHLAELLAVDMSVSSRHVAHLVEHGWIERAADPADKRSRILRLTPAGRQKLAELSRRSVELLAERLGDWSEADVEQLTLLLTRLRDGFGECRQGRPQHAVRAEQGERGSRPDPLVRPQSLVPVDSPVPPQPPPPPPPSGAPQFTRTPTTIT
ncbi:MarR family transcriptional regulator [Streptomyces sp. NPDC004539]|uniref:MarR family winged helix-turn-helix transcriptional regulator n=1 Tax=Streptomyces sp. NPDC004539 TaxID=3154280 RepID=UPI00339F954D